MLLVTFAGKLGCYTFSVPRLALPNTIRFKETAAARKSAVVLIYDLSNFSRFANHQGAQRYVPRFINHVSSAIDTIIYGGSPYWTDRDDAYYEPLLAPTHEKFLGDGGLYIWASADERELVRSTFVLPLCDRLRELRRQFGSIVRRARHDVPIASRPREIRFGLAMGDVTELRRRDARQHEYVGACINLASRLQNYCPGIGFLASATIGMNEFSGNQNGYAWVTAKHVKGFPREDVIVDRNEYESANPRKRAAKFMDR